MKKVVIKAENYISERDIDYHRKHYKDLSDDQLLEIHLSNFLWNYSILKNYPGILGFEGCLKGIPAVVVGAGPSLEKNMHLLKEYRDNLVIIAGDAALPVLVNKLQIYPDIVVMGDPTEKQRLNFKDIDTTKFLTIVSSVTHPSVFREIHPKHLAVYNVKSNSILLNMIPYHIGSKGSMPAGVLTSGSVFGLAGAMHCSPITFVGHDLCWENLDKVYADGVTDIKHNFQKSAKFKSDCLLFPDINGKLVVTHGTFINFYIWLRDTLRHIKTPVFNSSEAGILNMKELKVLSLEKWINKYCTKKIVGIKEKLEKAYNWDYKDGLVEKIILAPLKDKTRKIQ